MIISKTPFRISLFGGGTDYPGWYQSHGGACLSTTIDKYCYLHCKALPPFFDYRFRIVWSKTEQVRQIDEIQHPSVRECLRLLGIEEGIEIHHDADLPARAGLGSSSTFTVGLLHCLYAFRSRMVSKHQLAMDAIQVEQHLLRENVGCQDQVAAAFGGFNRLTFGRDRSIQVTPIFSSPERMRRLNDHMMLLFTGFARTASDVAAEQIRKIPEREMELHRILELVDEAQEIVVNHQRPIEEIGTLLHEGWLLKKSLSTKISNPLIDEIYDTARQAGALGGKLLGAGGGGFMLIFAKPEHQTLIRERLKKLLFVPFNFENVGSQIIVYQPQPYFYEGISGPVDPGPRHVGGATKEL